MAPGADYNNQYYTGTKSRDLRRRLDANVVIHKMVPSLDTALCPITWTEVFRDSVRADKDPFYCMKELEKERRRVPLKL